MRKKFEKGPIESNNIDDLWKSLMLMPNDYTTSALEDSITLKLMEKITCEPGGEEYEEHLPDGVPTSVKISFSSKLLFYIRVLWDI